MATINVRIDEELKKDTEKVLSDLGLNISTAVSIYFTQIVKQQEIPFKIKARKVVDPDNYYNEDWYKSSEAIELLDRIKNGSWRVHDLPNLKDDSNGDYI